MRISAKSKYALKLLVDLAENNGNDIIFESDEPVQFVWEGLQLYNLIIFFGCI